MYCDGCGHQAGDTAAFCSACGKSLRTPVAATRSSGRVSGHVRLLGMLWIADSALRVLPGLVLVGLGTHGLWFLPDEVPRIIPELLHTILPAIGSLLLLMGALGVTVGWGLLERQTWARPLAIVLGLLNLLHIPFGTALGAYTLWVLWPEASESEYQTLAQV